MNRMLIAAIAALGIAGCQSREDKLVRLRGQEASLQVRLIAMERDVRTQYCDDNPDGTRRCISYQTARDSLTIIQRRIDRLLR